MSNVTKPYEHESYKSVPIAALGEINCGTKLRPKHAIVRDVHMREGGKVWWCAFSVALLSSPYVYICMYSEWPFSCLCWKKVSWEHVICFISLPPSFSLFIMWRRWWWPMTLKLSILLILFPLILLFLWRRTDGESGANCNSPPLTARLSASGDSSIYGFSEIQVCVPESFGLTEWSVPLLISLAWRRQCVIGEGNSLCLRYGVWCFFSLCPWSVISFTRWEGLFITEVRSCSRGSCGWRWNTWIMWVGLLWISFYSWFSRYDILDFDSGGSVYVCCWCLSFRLLMSYPWQGIKVRGSGCGWRDDDGWEIADLGSGDASFDCLHYLFIRLFSLLVESTLIHLALVMLGRGSLLSLCIFYILCMHARVDLQRQLCAISLKPPQHNSSY